MITLTDVQQVEMFHLIVLAHLGQALDKRHFTLKGGCNFRFFFAGIRYSEDMDFDVHTISVSELRDRVGRVLAAPALRLALAAHGIEIEHVTAAKQTATTQRWKLGLQSSAATLPLATKIEFSRRPAGGQTLLEGVDPQLLGRLGLPALLVSHYPAAEAWRQKIGALAQRTVIQARDLFDLYFLLASGKVEPAADNRPVNPATLREAGRRCLTVPFAAFKSQVLSYLLPEHQAAYGSAGQWDTMALQVAEALGGSA